MSKCFAGFSSLRVSEGSREYPKACLTSRRYSSIHVLSAVLSLEGGRQELSKGKDLRESCGLLRNLSASFLSSSGGLRMKRFGGGFFLGLVVVDCLRWASSLRRRCGLSRGRP